MIRQPASAAAGLRMAQGRLSFALALLLASGSAWSQQPPAPPVQGTSPAQADGSPTPASGSVRPAGQPSPSDDAQSAADPGVDVSAGPPLQSGHTDVPVDARDASLPSETAPATDAGPEPSVPPAAATATDDATVAEGDFDELYGDGSGSKAAPAVVYDPWEPFNRRVHRFNNAVDRRVAAPLARTYVKVVPRPVRTGVSNFFNNLSQPMSAVNALLQGKPKQAGHSLGRFVVNSTLGIGGIFDPATDARLQNRSEDFGQTLGVWGWKRSRYVELPLFGPRTVRDIVGMAGDAPLSPLREVDSAAVRVPLQGLQLVDLRMQLMSTDALREGVEDDYALVRDAWSQRRAYQIDGDAADGDLPDYLREDPGMVPVDAIPVGGG